MGSWILSLSILHVVIDLPNKCGLRSSFIQNSFVLSWESLWRAVGLDFTFLFFCRINEIAGGMGSSPNTVIEMGTIY